MTAGGSWDIAKAITAKWNASSLNATFKALWTDAATSDYLVLNDTTARPGTPFPYCVFTQSPGLTSMRSGHESDPNKQRSMDSQIIEFYIYSDSKAECAELAAAVAAVFATGATLTVEGGSCYLHVKRLTDSPGRPDEKVYQWIVPVEVWYEYEE